MILFLLEYIPLQKYQNKLLPFIYKAIQWAPIKLNSRFMLYYFFNKHHEI